MVDMLSLSAIMSNPIFMWGKILFYVIIGGGIIYSIFYWLQYNVIVEYNMVMGNGVIKEVRRRAKRWNDMGSVKYKIWRSKIILKRPEDYSFITVIGKKEKIRLLALGDNKHLFLKLNVLTASYDTTPAEIEEWAVLTHEYYFKKYMEVKDKLGRALPWIGIGLGAIIFIVAMWFAVDLLTATSSHIGSLSSQLTTALDKFSEKAATVPGEVLPN